MLRTALACGLGLMIAASATLAEARSPDPWIHRQALTHHSQWDRASHVRAPRASHPRGSSAATVYRAACKAKCKSDYELNVDLCRSEPRGHKRECRQQESLTRKDCLAHCI